MNERMNEHIKQDLVLMQQSQPHTQPVSWDQAFFFFFLINLFYFWLHWVFVAARGLSLVAASGGQSSFWCAGFSLWWLLLLRSTGSRCVGLSCCGVWAQQLWFTGSRDREQAQQLWCTGLVAPRHVGSSWVRARTRVPCIGWQIFNHRTTKEVPRRTSFYEVYSSHSAF